MINIVRKLVVFSALAASIVIAGVVFYNPHPCLKPLRYSIGNVDDRFSVSTSTFRSLAKEAGQPWEEAAGHRLFQHDSEAAYTVNLVFDERQRRTNQTKQIRQELANLENKHQEAIKTYEQLKQETDEARAEYDAYHTQYKEKLDEYNETVTKWNERGGAPPEKARELKRTRRELEAMNKTLQEKRRRVKALTDKLQGTVDRQNKIVDELRSTANTYKTRFNHGREFEQGTFSGNEINVYQYKQLSDLRLVLSHELGHALGIKHVENAESVMYHMMGEQSLNPITLTEQDKRALDNVCADAGYFRLP